MRSTTVAMVIVLTMLEQSSETVISPCNGKADILFIIAASNTVTADNIKLVKKFVADISNNLDVGDDKNLISLMVSSHKSIIVFPFNATMTHQDIQQAALEAPFEGLSTNPANALMTAREKAFTSSNGARSGAKKVVIFLIDGRSNENYYTFNEAIALKNTNVTIIVVGIGSETSEQQIETISSGKQNIFSAESFDVLDNLQEGITKKICAVIPSCIGKSDILFMIDASNSVHADNFEKEKKFVADISKKFDVGAQNNLISLMVFSTEAIILFGFNATMTHQDIKQAVKEAHFVGGGTYPDKAFKMAGETAFTSSKGARPGANKVVILLIDGRSANRFVTLMEATALKETNVTIIVVQIGSQTDQVEIRNISSGEQYIFSAESFDVLDNLQEGITNNICEVPPPCMIDLLFIIDASTSIGAKAFEPEKKFLADSSNTLNLGAENILISLLVYSDEATIVFPFDAKMTHQDIQQAVMNLPYKGGNHDKGKALELAKSAFTSRNGARPGAEQLYLILEGLDEHISENDKTQSSGIWIELLDNRVPDNSIQSYYTRLTYTDSLYEEPMTIAYSVKSVCEEKK